MSFEVKTGLSGLNTEKTIVFSRSVLTKMEGNPNFPSPLETPAEITVKVNVLQEIQEKILQGHVHMIPLRDTALSEVHTSMKKLCTYVNLTAGGNQTMLETSGFPFVKTPAPRPAPEKVDKVTVSQGNRSGRVIIKWKAAKHRLGYKFQMSNNADEESSWVDVDMTTKPHAEVEGLDAGKKYWFRVCAYNTAGSSAWSEATGFMVG
jgi:hypothetical protein